MAEREETGPEASTSNLDPTVPPDSYWPERREGKRPTRAEKGSWLGQTELIDEVSLIHLLCRERNINATLCITMGERLLQTEHKHPESCGGDVRCSAHLLDGMKALLRNLVFCYHSNARCTCTQRRSPS